MGPSVSVSTHPEGRNVTPVIRLRVNAGYRLEFAFRTCPSGMPRNRESPSIQEWMVLTGVLTN
jgi:hypothetical protein